MKKRALMMVAGVMITVSAFAFNYDPDYWTSCLTEARDANGELLENDYYCNQVSDMYNGEPAEVFQCQAEAGGFSMGGCAANSLFPYPEVQH